MTSSAECCAFALGTPEATASGVSPSEKHEKTLSSYLLNSHHGPSVVRDIIVADIRGFIDLGLPHVAADLVIVLRLLLAQFPEARRVTRPPIAWDGSPFELPA